MAIIKKPAAADSPYPVTADTTPAVLRASASGATVLANLAAAAVTAAVTDTAAANVSYYATGVEGVQGLANYGRVFAGANVYVTLEQPQYITYNQSFVGNGTVGGTDGQIQFNNNGAFGGSVNLTFDGANLAVGQNITADYFVGNGSQLTGISGGSSNKIFNGNSYANIATANGNVTIGANGAVWTFGTTGTLAAPGNISTAGNVIVAGNQGLAVGNINTGNAWTIIGDTIRAPGGARLQSTFGVADTYLTSVANGYINLQSLYADSNIASELHLEHGLAQITAHSLGDTTDYVWTFNDAGNLTFPENSGCSWPINTQRFGMGNIGAWLDGQWTIGEFSGNGVSGTVGIRIDPAIEGPVGMTFPSSETSNTQPVQIYSTNGSGIQLYTGGNNWTFNANGSTVFPTLTVDLHNGGNTSGQTLQFGDPNQQAFITGPAPLAEGYAAQRLIIQGQYGNTGEGGDVYIWGGDSQANGGDIKIYAGDADTAGRGGNIHIAGGRGTTDAGEITLIGGRNDDGVGARVDLTGGLGSTGGGGINLTGGYGSLTGGNVAITGGISGNGLAYYGNVNIAAGASTWSFKNNGTTEFPNNVINPGNNQPLTLRTQSSGNAYTIMYQSSNSWEAYAEDDTTEANSAYAWIKADLNTANTPRVFINNVRGGDGLDSTWTFDDAGNLTLPNGASLKDTAGDSVAFGQAAGANSQQQHAVAIGLNAGREFQGEDSIAIGKDAGYYNQNRGVAIGYLAGRGTVQSTPVSATYGGSGPAHTYVSGDGNPSLVLDSVTNVITYNQYVTGNNIPANTYVTNIYPGEDRIEISQAPTAPLIAGDVVTFIGSNIGVASTSSLVAGARVFGNSIPTNTYINNILGPNNIDISQRPSAPLVDGDYLEFYIGQGDYATAVGYDAGTQYQNARAVAVGYNAGTNHQGANTVAVGYSAGGYSQSTNAVAVGASAGAQTQGINTVAIGYQTGGNTQGARAVAIGEDAGNDNQHAGAVAIGAEAGRTQQGNAAVAMGWKAGNYLQGLNAIAIGEDAGRDNQGAYSIAIGYYAGFNSQANNTVVLNATGSYLTALTANTFVVAPVRASTLNNYSLDTGNVLYYNTSTHEITTAPVNNITGDPFAAYASSTGNVTVWTASSDQVVGAKLTVRVVYYNYDTSNWQNTEMLDIAMAKTYPDGTPAFTVSNRIKTNAAYTSVPIDVTLATGNVLQVISSAPDGAGNNVYWTCSATSFNQTFD